MKSIRPWQQAIGWFLVALLLFSCGSLLHGRTQKEQPWENPYGDVSPSMWSYQYITELNRLGVYPDQAAFEPEAVENRGNLAQHLYRMDGTVFAGQKAQREETAKKEKQAEPETPVFGDVDGSDPESERYQAICWAAQNGIMSGTGEGNFSPDVELNREQVCAVMTRFAAFEQAQLAKIVEPDQFTDSLEIDPFARSGVTACQMAAVVKGSDGYFLPMNVITRQEVAAILYRVVIASQAEYPEGTALVDLTAGAYDYLYDSYTPPTAYSQALIPANETEVPLSYFDQTAFIGDSVSVMLESYCNATQALGGAKFLCAGSMSPTNMLDGIILPEYPKGSGNKPPIEDSVAQTGAQVVYIMLGMNNLSYGLDTATGNLVKVIDLILSKSPDVTIVVESVTPMTETSPRKTEKLNNDVINQYNAQMQAICQERQWYFLNVAEALRDENGFLRPEYCSDPNAMGMHFTYAGCEVWVNYLKTHVPQEVLYKLNLG